MTMYFIGQLLPHEVFIISVKFLISCFVSCERSHDYSLIVGGEISRSAQLLCGHGTKQICETLWTKMASI